MASLNYNHLRYFWVVAHEPSLTQAAARLNVSQSAISVQLQKLEQQIGQQLFERVGKKLRLTESGRIALDYADTVFAIGEEMLSALHGRHHANRQVLRVGALTTLSRNFQIEFVRPLIGRTDVEIVVRSGMMRELLAQLEAHALDVVLANRPAHRDVSTPLQSRLLDEQPVSLVGRPAADGAAAAFRFPQDLDGMPIILPSLESEMRHDFDRVVGLLQVAPQVIAEIDDMAMLRLLARESGALTLVPPIVVQDELRDGILVEWCRVPNLSESFYAITQKRRYPNPLLADLIDRTVDT